MEQEQTMNHGTVRDIRGSCPLASTHRTWVPHIATSFSPLLGSMLNFPVFFVVTTWTNNHALVPRYPQLPEYVPLSGRGRRCHLHRLLYHLPRGVANLELLRAQVMYHGRFFVMIPWGQSANRTDWKYTCQEKDRFQGTVCQSLCSKVNSRAYSLSF